MIENKKIKVCSICGKKFDMLDEQLNFGIHMKATYGSIFDGNTFDYDFCCNCFDDLIGKILQYKMIKR